MYGYNLHQITYVVKSKIIMPVQELDVLSQEQSEAILQQYSTVEVWQSYLEVASEAILDSHILEFPEHCIGWEVTHMSAFDDALHSESCSGLLGEIHGIDFKGYVSGLPEDFAEGCTALTSLEVRGFIGDFAHFAEDVHVENITFRGSLPGLDQERFEFAYNPDISLPTWGHLKSISFIDIGFKSLQGTALSVERLHVENAFYYQPLAIPEFYYYHHSEHGVQLPESEHIPHDPHVSNMPHLKHIKFANVSANHITHWLQQFPQVFFYFEGSKPNCPRMITKFFFYNSLKPFIHAIKIFSGNCCIG